MAFLFRPRTTQLLPGLRLDPNNPLTRGIVSCVPAMDSFGRAADIVPGNAHTFTGTSFPFTGPAGYNSASWAFTNASTTDLAFSSTGVFSVAAFFNLQNLSFAAQVVSRGVNTSETVNTGWALRYESTGSVGSFQIYGNDAFTSYGCSATTAMALGDHTLVGTNNGSNLRSIYQDGKLEGTTTLNPIPPATASNFTNVFGSSAVPTYIAVVWNRCLSAQEAKSFSDNPWQILWGGAPGGLYALASTISTTVFTMPGSSTWTVPSDCPAGTVITIETWGAGSGGSGRVSTTFGSGGAGGAYAQSPYTITPHDITNGIPFVVGAKSAGLSGADPVAGGDSSWSTNNLNLHPDTRTSAGIAGTPGTLPTNWFFANLGTLSTQIVGVGTTTEGFSYCDIRLFGTTSTTSCNIFTSGSSTQAVVTAAQYTLSMYSAVVGGSTNNVSSLLLISDSSTSSAYVGSVGFTAMSITSTLTRTTSTVTYAATSVKSNLYASPNFTSGVAIDITFRLAASQVESGASATFWKSTPGYTLAKGGGAPSGLTGGVGGTTAASVGFTMTSAGGSGAAYNVAGSGGGGAGGKNGAGNTGTTAGVGGQGDGTAGGLGGAVKATSPGNPGIS